MGEVMRQVLIVLAVVLATFGIWVGMAFTGLEGGDLWWPLAWAVWAPVGAMILYRRPGNGVGRTQMAIGLSWGIAFIGLAVAYNAEDLAVRVWGEWLGLVLGVVPWLSIVWLLLVFPSGRPVRRLEKVTAAGVVLFGVLAAAAFTLSSVPTELTGQPSPLAVPSLDWGTAWLVSDSGFVIVILLLAAAIVALVTRWRASRGVERHQFRWLLLGALFFFIPMAVGQVLPEDSSFLFIWIAAGAAIPVVIGVAVLRYRLYEIDRIISRTVSYALIVGFLGLVLFGLVAGLGAWLGSENQLVVAVSTLAVAGLFNPVRRRVQGWVDRRFNRSRYDAERVMSEFGLSLRDRVDPDGVVDGWVGVVSETMQPESVGVWVR
jgi:hypothetical protein